MLGSGHGGVPSVGQDTSIRPAAPSPQPRQELVLRSTTPTRPRRTASPRRVPPAVRVYFGYHGMHGYVDFAAAWPGIGVLACVAQAMSDVTRGCPVCPEDAPASAFLVALAESAPLEVAADLYGLAAEWS